MRGKRWICLITALVIMLTLTFAHASEYGAQVVSAPISYVANARSGMVRVYLSSLGAPASLDVTVSGSYSVSGQTTMVLNSGEKLHIAFNSSSGQITMTRAGQSYDMGREMAFRRHMTESENGIQIAQSRKPGNLYPGDLKLIAQASGGSYRLYPILSVYIEEYLEGVLPYEMGNSAPMEALKAQAVAARTYTVGRMNARAAQLYDVVDTTNDQVYYGHSTGTANCAAAVDATRGIVLQNDGQPTSTYYTASNGGQTESAKNFFGTDKYPYLTVKDDPFDRMNPNSVVRKVTVYADNTASGQNAALRSLLQSKAVAALRDRGYDTSAAQVLTIHSITPHTPKYDPPSRLYTKLDFAVTASIGVGTVELLLTCDIFGELENALGMSINTMSNELWTVERAGSQFVLKASRFGHGVGMSQRGAMQIGSLGYTYDQILGFYFENSQRVQYTFTHTILSAVGTGDDVITGVDTPAAISPSDGSYATVRLVGVSDQLALRSAPEAEGPVLTTLMNGALVSVLMKGDAWSLVRLGRITGYAPTANLIFSGEAPTETTERPTVVTRWATVTCSGTLNLRASGSTSAKALTQIPSGAVLCVFSVSGGWAEVQYGATDGWASTDFLRMSEVFPGQVNVSASSATVQTASGGPVNLRKTASTSSAIVTALAHGTNVQVIANDGSWCLVSVNGQEGYVLAEYLDFGSSETPAAPSQTPSPPATLGDHELEAIVRTASGTLNLREQPNTQARILAALPRGESIVVTNRGADWCAVRYGALTGYMMTEFLHFPADDRQEATSWALVTTQSSALNLRSLPQTGSSIVTTLPRGARVGIVAWREDGWAHVKYESWIGYASASYLTPEGEAAVPTVAPTNAMATVATAGGGLNLRESASTAARVLLSIPNGAQVGLLESGADWFRVSWQGQTGYVMASYLRLPDAAVRQTMWILPSVVGGVNLRREASYDAEVLTSLPARTAVTMTGASGDWNAVEWNGLKGYVLASYLTDTEPAAKPQILYVSAASGVNLRQGPSTDTAIVATLPASAAVEAGALSGDWQQVHYGTLEGYILACYLAVEPPEEIDAAPSVDASAPASETYDPTLVDVPNWHASVTATSLNVRAWCAVDAPILQALSAGIQVDVLRVGDDWCHIRYEGTEGYCKTEFLNLLPAMP